MGYLSIPYLIFITMTTNFTNNEKGLHLMLMDFGNKIQLITDFQEQTITLYYNKIIKEQFSTDISVRDFSLYIEHLQQKFK